MRNAETTLGITLDHWRADLRSKDSRAVRRGAVGKVLYRATRRQPTLLHVRFCESLWVRFPWATLLPKPTLSTIRRLAVASRGRMPSASFSPDLSRQANLRLVRG